MPKVWKTGIYDLGAKKGNSKGKKYKFPVDKWKKRFGCFETGYLRMLNGNME